MWVIKYFKSYLGWYGGQVGKSQKVDNPNTSYESNEGLLTNEVDTGEVNGEKEADTRHELAVANLVKHYASNKSGEKVCNSTEKVKDYLFYSGRT